MERILKVLIFAGTTEGRLLSEYLAQAGIRHTLCVATEYGEIVLKNHPLVTVHQGRMEPEEMRAFILKGNYLAVVDATHPYARIVTRNIKEVMTSMPVPYLRLKREALPEAEKEGGLHNRKGQIVWFDTAEACARALEDETGNILLATGSRELAKYCACEEVKSRLYVRVLPSMESLSLCLEQGICGKQVIAMQGPFTEEMNEAVIRQYGISCLVTKESGRCGGFPEKQRAAERTGIKLFVIGRPEEEEGYSFPEICRELEKLLGQSIPERKLLSGGFLEITLAGIGMGSRGSLTREVQEAIAGADILLGAERMLAPYQPRLEKRPFYRAGQIISYLKELQAKNLPAAGIKTVVLFSGDSGFYSGCQMLCRALEEEIRKGALRARVRILPGISSVAALAARAGESYQDAAVYSMHGKEVPGLAQKIMAGSKTFLLMSGVRDVNRLGALLEKAGMDECEVTVGYQMSYEEEEVRTLSPRECSELKAEGLYTCMVKNPHVKRRFLTHGMADGAFIRDKVPMTKEEVREISICKLRLYEGAAVYDIGSGTGSLAVEMAGLGGGIQVYAIERKKEAVLLIEKNKEKFGLENITVVEAKAPEGLEGLPAATHAFIGGSGGELKAILAELYRMNPQMRIVINAVSVETICEIREWMDACGRQTCQNEEIIQVQVSRGTVRGSHHLMQAENPVWICAFDFVRRQVPILADWESGDCRHEKDIAKEYGEGK